MKQIAYVDDLYVNRLKIQSIAHDRDDVDIFFIINKGWHGLSGEWCGHLAWREKSSSGV